MVKAAVKTSYAMNVKRGEKPVSQVRVKLAADHTKSTGYDKLDSGTE